MYKIGTFSSPALQSLSVGIAEREEAEQRQDCQHKGNWLAGTDGARDGR
jgi:hypothetical protein